MLRTQIIARDLAAAGLTAQRRRHHFCRHAIGESTYCDNSNSLTANHLRFVSPKTHLATEFPSQQQPARTHPRHPSPVSRDATRSAPPLATPKLFPANAFRRHVAILSPKPRATTKVPRRQNSPEILTPRPEGRGSHRAAASASDRKSSSPHRTPSTTARCDKQTGPQSQTSCQPAAPEWFPREQAGD